MNMLPQQYLPSHADTESADIRSNRVSRTVASLLTLALLAALTTIACSEPNARISFISDRDGSEEIYVMNADGSDVTRLTDTDGHIIGYPRWSPDGQRIAFTSDQNGNNDIYVVNADGSGLIRLTHSDRDDSNPDWSPDGQRIAFISGHPGDLESYLKDAGRSDFADRGRVKLLGSFDIYIVNTDGSDLTQLTDSSETEFYPRWSPDGLRIMFISDRDGDSEIYTMNADGSGLTRLTHNREHEMFPNWLPNGQHIMFFTWTGPLTMLHQMNADGSGRTKLIHQDVEIESFHSLPVFSADGQRVERVVLFADRDQDDEDEIYLANADGSGLTQLTIDDSYQGGRDERPVVFSTTIYDGNGDDEIYIMNPDGSGLVRLTDNTSRDFAPHFTPAP